MVLYHFVYMAVKGAPGASGLADTRGFGKLLTSFNQ